MFKKNKIWTRDFKLLTVGSFVTYMGTSTIAYTIGFMVLETFESVLYYSLYLCLYNAVRLMTPIVAGAFLDRCSRKKALYSLNLCLAIALFFFWIMLKNGHFLYWTFFILVIVIGGAESSYRVSYKSFYPLLTEKDNFTQANAIVTVLETTSIVMVPIGTVLYKLVGMEPVLLICSICLFLAAIIEMFIKKKELYITKKDSSAEKKYIYDLKEGVSYVASEKGLIYIIICEFSLCLIWGTQNTILLPFCNESYNNGYLWYIVISSGLMTGEFWGSCAMYFIKISPRKAYKFFALLTIIPFFSESLVLFLPVWLMIAINLLFGMTSAISENIKFTSSQVIVEENLRGRFNGVYSTTTSLGMLAGQLLVGLLSEMVSLHTVNLIICCVAFAIQLSCCWLGKGALKEVFERCEDKSSSTKGENK